MTKIAFFGHDAADAAIRRRVVALQADGIAVTGFMMRRRAPLAQEWINIDLGETRDGAFVQRIRQVFRGARIAAKAADELRSADVIYARNLDMLACAFLAKRHAGLSTPVIYECLDIHRLLCRKDPVGWTLRAFEGWLLKKCRALIVSSPAFVREHFDRYYSGGPKVFLVENRLTGGADYGDRGVGNKAQEAGKLRIGWVGNLRCRRSLDLLCSVAGQFGTQVEIRLHGVVAKLEIPDFDEKISRHPNVSFHGRYRSPEDLSEIYKGLDVVWSGDFMEAGLNSVWLLPNRIYEGGYFRTPAIAPAGTETGNWVEHRACGFTLEEPLEKSLPTLIGDLLDDPTRIRGYSCVLGELPEETFVQPLGFLRQVITQIIGAKVPS
ncbi:glycosyl transferase family 1 [Hyphomonas sp. WL0036]|uniref:glycosyltransferase n=1 Tax=Hyphomonas sediminis TaxID=2866160 RepID=UPI001C7FC479|nr:glycosyltransferase [Hyphomonas sediminis]MBY9067953.1 glycosyl transferase family 1 [Hyphomonas sediminis]